MAFKFERPDNFAPFAVKFTDPSGGEASIKAVFKYRTRKEFAALLNEVFGNAEKIEGDQIDFVALTDKDIGKAADRLIESLVSWDVEGFALNKASLTQLADECPAAISAMWTSYRMACTEGRLGN
jgi:hypothetical protein